MVEKFVFKDASPHVILCNFLIRIQHELNIANKCNIGQFKADIKAHQQGQTDYLTFIGISAKLGIEKWAVCMDKMTFTYFDKAGNEILGEKIPQ